GAGAGDFIGQLADLGGFGRFQSADLALEGADAGDLADAGWNAEEKSVAGHVEGARGNVALVALGLHLFGARNASGQMLAKLSVNFVIGGQQARASRGVG